MENEIKDQGKFYLSPDIPSPEEVIAATPDIDMNQKFKTPAASENQTSEHIEVES